MKTKIVISLVSHGHNELIINNKYIIEYINNVNITLIIKDNVNSKELKSFAQLNNIDYLVNQKPKGFGHNNNDIFDFALNKYEFDLFICLNPDVFLAHDVLCNFCDDFVNSPSPIGAINLFKNEKFTEHDYSIRNFPTFIDFFSSFFLTKNPSIISKESLITPTIVDWAAGSFLAFKKESYMKLSGFDLRYFMYCEDIDICWRGKQTFGQGVCYYPQYKAVHYAAHSNRRILSKHFFWHLSSVIKFLRVKGF